MPEKSAFGPRPIAQRSLTISATAPMPKSPRLASSKRSPNRKPPRAKAMRMMTKSESEHPLVRIYESQQQNRFGWPRHRGGHQFDRIICVQEKLGRILLRPVVVRLVSWIHRLADLPRA